MQLTEKLRTANVFDNAKFKYKLRANKKMNAHHNESLQIVEKSKQINKKTTRRGRKVFDMLLAVNLLYKRNYKR